MVKKTIVIISSNRLFPLLFETLLFRKIDNLELIICNSIEDIDQKVNSLTVNLTLMDSILNSTPSFEVMRYLRMEKRLTSPIFFFPEIRTDFYAYKSYVMGASLLINKPFDPYKVTEEIADSLNENDK